MAIGDRETMGMTVMRQQAVEDATAVLAFLTEVNDHHLYGIVDDATKQRMERVVAFLQSEAIAAQPILELIHEEYPNDYSLAKMAFIWTAATTEEIAALQAWEANYGDPPKSEEALPTRPAR